jgi:hypothetical protein
MWDARRAATPMKAGIEIEAAKESIRMEAFRSLIRRIGWLVMISRPDISYIISKLARMAIKPLEQIWAALKHLLRYL